MKRKYRDTDKHKGIYVTPYHFNKQIFDEKEIEEKAKKTDEELLQAKKTKQNSVIIAIAVLAVALVLAYCLKPKKSTGIETFISENQVAENVKPQQLEQSYENKADSVKQKPEYIQQYLNINESTIGYIKIDNTMIDYPVLQTDNNDYYMNHDINYDETMSGLIFMDFRCDIDDFSKTRNIILYGDRMKDGSMFKGLLNYQDKDFFINNRIIQFDTINESLEWKVFSAFETTTDFYYIDTEFPYDEMWISFLEECKSLSMHNTHTHFYKDDIVLTLSTCSTDENGRFVVMAKLIY